MKHLFTSGEVLYKKNNKFLKEGEFRAEGLAYDEVSQGALYEAHGVLNDRPAVIKFKLKGEFVDELHFKSKLKILMQSDLFLTEWEEYEITEL